MYVCELNLRTNIRKLLGNISFIVLLNILIKPIWLLIDAESQNKIGHADYGLFASLFALGHILATLADFGINQYITKKIAAESSQQKYIYPVVYYFKLSMMLLYPTILVLVGMAVGYQSRELFYLGLVGVAQALTQLLFFYRATFQANQRFMIDSTASVLDKFMLIGLVCLLLYTDTMTLDNFVFARIASLGLSVVVYYAVSLKLFGFILPRLDLNYLTDLVRVSFPFALITVLYSINEKIDQIMIHRLSHDHADAINHAGNYAGGYRWLDAIMMYLWTILPIFFAKFAHHLNEHSAKQRLFNVGHVISSVPMTFVCVFVFFYGDILFVQFNNSTASDISTMTSVLKILFISAFFQGIFALYSTLLTSTGHELKVSVMIIGSIVINIVLNYFLLVNNYGPIGSAYVTVISTVFLSICYVIYIDKYTGIKIPYSILLRLGVTYLLFGATFYLLDYIKLHWIVVTTLSGAALLIFSWFTGLIKILIQKGEL